MKILRLLLVTAAALLLAACAYSPAREHLGHPVVAQRAPVAPAAAPARGAIYRGGPSGGWSLFEDRRPRNVGDVLTILVRENSSASELIESPQKRTRDPLDAHDFADGGGSGGAEAYRRSRAKKK